jgi:transposase-like protein
MQRYSREERENHLSTWRASGMSGQAYCRQHNIVSTTFYSWVKAEKTRIALESAASSVMVRVAPSPNAGKPLSSTICIEKRDVRIHLPANIGTESLQLVLQLLGVVDAA